MDQGIYEVKVDQPTGRAFIQVSQEIRDNSILLLFFQEQSHDKFERNILNREFGIED
ncbi:10661_t:CDS:2 [Funneliformis geosporum]|uniref:17382_t:CDS:1 n=1 Tax=Funneliformis geosporum TaxID=1117311 RepID=A0A9W4WQ64_9GLOM|nr:17382_t:CDS:2 [Funneliformis geosporum]CAI2181444.1 10661_t:CDS:2 [Funneliformis geosporum]